MRVMHVVLFECHYAGAFGKLLSQMLVVTRSSVVRDCIFCNFVTLTVTEVEYNFVIHNNIVLQFPCSRLRLDIKSSSVIHDCTFYNVMIISVKYSSAIHDCIAL